MTTTPAEDLPIGTRVVPRSAVRVLHARLHHPDTWRMTNVMGRGAYHITPEEMERNWEVLHGPDEVVVPVALLERLRTRHSGKAFVGADVPLIEALIDLIPTDPHQEKVEALARTLFQTHREALRVAGGQGAWNVAAADVRQAFLAMAEAAIAELEGDDA